MFRDFKEFEKHCSRRTPILWFCARFCSAPLAQRTAHPGDAGTGRERDRGRRIDRRGGRGEPRSGGRLGHQRDVECAARATTATLVNDDETTAANGPRGWRPAP